jgi:hypothetical protein
MLLMPRDGAIIFADLIGKLDVLYVHCPKCSRAGRYGVQHLVEARGRNAKLIDWLGLAEGAVVRSFKTDFCTRQLIEMPSFLFTVAIRFLRFAISSNRQASGTLLAAL